MIDYLARLYVNLIEPAFLILLAVVALAFVVYLFTLVRGGDAKNSLAGYVVNATFKSIMKTLELAGKGIVRFFKLLLKTIVVLLATMRDFFKSKI